MPVLASSLPGGAALRPIVGKRATLRLRICPTHEARDCRAQRDGATIAGAISSHGRATYVDAGACAPLERGHCMAAYVIAEVEVRNADSYAAAYSQHVRATIEQYGGRFLVRGGTVDVVEGDWDPPRLVILEFESMERARAWYDSGEYQAILPGRQQHARSNVIMVQGA